MPPVCIIDILYQFGFILIERGDEEERTGAYKKYMRLRDDEGNKAIWIKAN